MQQKNEDVEIESGESGEIVEGGGIRALESLDKFLIRKQVEKNTSSEDKLLPILFQLELVLNRY